MHGLLPRKETVEMIAPAVIAEVRRLLVETRLSRRKIAGQLGLSRGTVNAIASGRRADHAKEACEEEEEPLGPPSRCPTCGGMVYMPCRLCRVRRIASSRPKSKPARLASEKTASDADLLRPSLRPEHQRRFEEVQTWRRQCTPDP
jgi:hypothetical protein